MFQSQSTYCSGTGLSRPIWRFSAAIWAGVAVGPAAASAAPPGVICTSAKVTTVATTTVGTIAIRRRTIVETIGSAPPCQPGALRLLGPVARGQAVAHEAHQRLLGRAA